MDAALRLLSEGGPLSLFLVGGAVLGALVDLAFVALGVRNLRGTGSPRRAVLLAALLALPLLVLAGGWQASILTEPAAAALAFRARILTGAAGLILALPVGVATCLWAGIAAARRTAAAGERARLAAQAAGHGGAGVQVAAALQRSRAPEIGGAIGLLAAIFVIGAPSVGLLAAGLDPLENEAFFAHLAPENAAVLGGLQAAHAAEVLRTSVWIGAGGAAVVALLLGTLVHAGSSRRRNLAVALRALESAHLQAEPRAQVLRALEASGRPGPWAPLLLCLLLLALAILAWASALRLQHGAREGEAVALLSTGLSTGVSAQEPSPRIIRPLGSAPMELIAFPEDVAIGGIDAQAGLLEADAEQTIREAEALVLSLLRGDRAWRQQRPAAPRTVAVTGLGPRAVA